MSETLREERPPSKLPNPTANRMDPTPDGEPMANREQRPSVALWIWIALAAAAVLGLLYVISLFQ